MTTTNNADKVGDRVTFSSEFLDPNAAITAMQGTIAEKLAPDAMVLVRLDDGRGIAICTDFLFPV